MVLRRTVAILGGGGGARTAAAEFGMGGHDVRMVEPPDLAHTLHGIADAGAVTAVGAIAGTGAVRVCTDVAEAVDGADVALICVPTNYQLVFADMLAPHLRDGLHVVVMPGSLGSLALVEHFRQMGVTADITVSEIAALPYATRITGPASVKVFGRRRYVAIGTFPATASGQVHAVMDDLYPGIVSLANVLEAGLNNPNPTLHCMGVLLSSSRIEFSHGEFYYYEEGMTPHVCEAIEAMDAERLAIGATLGVDVLSLVDTYPTMGYGPKGDSLWSVIRGVRALYGIKGPTHLDSRYLTEDVPIGLTMYAQLGRQLGVPTPLMDGVIAISGAALGRDWSQVSRTPANCGIAGLGVDALTQYVTDGRLPATQ